ncbi:hypothetical protein LZ31DRAFT_209361 [Colletotrichum somersetense]|nr:hypothetical protein LZ31DRAFT_209361 [Colletotrichum somersetense]
MTILSGVRPDGGWRNGVSQMVPFRLGRQQSAPPPLGKDQSSKSINSLPRVSITVLEERGCNRQRGPSPGDGSRRHWCRRCIEVETNSLGRATKQPQLNAHLIETLSPGHSTTSKQSCHFFFFVFLRKPKRGCKSVIPKVGNNIQKHASFIGHPAESLAASAVARALCMHFLCGLLIRPCHFQSSAHALESTQKTTKFSDTCLKK